MPNSRARLARRAGRGLVVVVVALVALVGAAACGGDDDTATTGPAVAVQDDRIPVARSDELAPRIEMLAETGAKVARLDLFWSSIAPTEPADPTDPADPAYDFSQADFVLSGYAERGIDTIVSVYNTPAWAARNGQGPPAGTPINNNFPKADAFGDFMGAVVARYSGTFQPDGADQPLPATSHFEIWNEPNFRSFLGPQVEEGRLVAADAYAEMAEAAYPAIKTANPEAIVIVGVGGPRGASGEGATGARPWLQALRERDIPLDAYSQHIYPAAAPDVETIAFPSWSSIDGFLAELDEWKPGLDLYITEAGYTTASTPFRKSHVTEEEQAQYLTEIFALPQVDQERVAAIVWFNLQDNEFWPAGLIRADGTRKPSYDSFTEVVAQRGELTLPTLGEDQASSAP